MKGRDLKKWENQARRFFGDDFWEDIISVLPDADQPLPQRTNSGSTPQPQKSSGPRPQTPGQPAVDVYKTEKQFLVLVELPGLHNVDQIDVYMHGSQLIVSGTVARRFSQHQTLHSERFHGDFRRVIPLQEPIEEEKIEARYVQGILEIRLPFRPRTKGQKKRIRIDTDP
ncbi:Hsp20/alpha crystallin family protein [Tumebacillus sp. ITR2]|uniref:Hsp20/alpha crystallin family protein n=1 Tax=Tumebacillus amylolyticus TaxID=2801339 RepID=A0ABS1JE65_9BACL|nr:Hsp20/alpha crystallin family protein [Tumebacillus amylolyticus]MBL0388279.1 Hsp20/alpha crystallin family protein [Tumebacillus amylolyticus]